MTKTYETERSGKRVENKLMVRYQYETIFFHLNNKTVFKITFFSFNSIYRQIEWKSFSKSILKLMISLYIKTNEYLT